MSEPFAVVGLLERDDLILAISRRNQFDDLGFPGGRIEAGETPEQTLIRELFEEIGVEVLDYKKVFEAVDSLNKLCWMYRVLSWRGEPYAKEGDAAVRWVRPAQLVDSAMTFADYNIGALRSLNLYAL